LNIQVVEGRYELARFLALNKNVTVLDYHLLQFPLTVRPWKMGDRFVPYGMEGTKLVSDYLIDEKLSLFEKEEVMVIEVKDKIAAVVGHRTSDVYAAKSFVKKLWVAHLDLLD
jgi:tRNA(Ile)-lysidine synthase